MQKFLKNIIVFLQNYKIINQITSKNFKIVFFSENRNYQKYSSILIEAMIDEYPNEILYVSTDKNDFIDNKNIKNLFLENDYITQFFFLKLKCKNMLTTTIDLGNNILAKSKNTINYIYYFHSPVSTTKVYTNKAFDNYDTILCIGNFQKEEIRRREKIKHIKKKKIIDLGYPYFDYLKNKLDRTKFDKSNNILVAPSWNYNEKNYINEDFSLIIDSLLETGFNVIFRPHPEHFKRSKKFIEDIKNKNLNKNFLFDNENENFSSMQKSISLITDNSGIAIEYSLIIKRPVFYYDSLKKTHNSDIDDFNDMFNLEETLKNNFGYIFNYSNIINLGEFISNNIVNFNNTKKDNLDRFLYKNFFNVYKTKTFIKKNINNFIV
jgi:YidC/Oxa1 family membrane protein insertase